MRIIYSDHAERRIGQKGVTKLEVEHVLKHAKYIIKTRKNRKFVI